jgi:hypothetical protein
MWPSFQKSWQDCLPDALSGGAGAILQIGDGAGDVLYGDDHAQLVRRVHADQRRVQLLRLGKAVLRIRVTFWYGSGSGDPYICLADPDPTPNPAQDPAIFVSDLQDGNKIFFFYF